MRSISVLGLTDYQGPRAATTDTVDRWHETDHSTSSGTIRSVEVCFDQPGTVSVGSQSQARTGDDVYTLTLAP